MMILIMRTTLTLDDDILQAAKELAALQGITTGQSLSNLARLGLARHEATTQASRNGVPLLPEREGESIVTLQQVNEIAR